MGKAESRTLVLATPSSTARHRSDSSSHAMRLLPPTPSQQGFLSRAQTMPLLLGRFSSPTSARRDKSRNEFDGFGFALQSNGHQEEEEAFVRPLGPPSGQSFLLAAETPVKSSTSGTSLMDT